MADAFTVELLFRDGRPNGIIKAELSGWSGEVLVAPRVQISEVLKDELSRRTGVYILVKEDEDRPVIYVGEGECVGDRIREHLSKKDWWFKVIVITSVKHAFNISHAKFLEAHLIKQAKKVGDVQLENTVSPRAPRLGEMDRVKAESILRNLEVIFPALGYDYFLERRREKADENLVNSEYTVFEIESQKRGVSATAILARGEFVVQKNSRASYGWTSTSDPDHSYSKLHSKLIENRVLVRDESNTSEYRIFGDNYEFQSVSAAAAVVLGRPASGPSEWKVKGTKESYKEWENRTNEAPMRSPVATKLA